MAHNKAGYSECGCGCSTRKARDFFCCIFTVPRKRSRGTLGTAYTAMHGYIHLLHREDQARLCLTAKLHVLVWENPSFVLSRKPGDEATWTNPGTQAEVARARAPVCPSLVPALICGFCMQNSYFRTRLTNLYGSQTSSVVLSTHNSVLSTRINRLYWFQPSPVVLCMQNSDLKTRTTSLCGA